MADTRPARWWNEMPTIFMVVIVFLAVLKPSFAQAQSGPVHFVPERLARIAPWFQEQADKGPITGVVVGIARPDKVEYLQAIGTEDRARKNLVRQPIRPPGAQLAVRVDGNRLTIEAVGPWSVLDFDRGKPVVVDAVSNGEFQFWGGDHTRLSFAGDRVVLNPGPWQIEGTRVH